MVKLEKRPILLLIMDGWGVSSEKEGNAIRLAKTPNFDSYVKKYPYTELHASEEHVGLIEGIQGSSEVGHMNIGAGRVVYQMLSRINKSIQDHSFEKNDAFLEAFKYVQKHDSTLHLMGLMSGKGVHSDMKHLYAIMRLAKEYGIKDIIIHFFGDGRDSPPQSSLEFLDELEHHIRLYDIGKIGTVMGRYYSMDRDKRWDRTELAFNAIVHGKAEMQPDAKTAIEKSYGAGVHDEFIKPVIIADYDGMKENDAVIFFNYRSDRTRQMTHAMTEDGFDQFKTDMPKVDFVAMTKYYDGIKAKIAFPPEKMKNILAEYLSKNDLKQLRIAETEKYPHVTFFFNGSIEKVYPGEERIIIPSPKVSTYDEEPKMSALEVKEKVIKEILEERFDFIVLNFANPDMVGHTGFIPATIDAVETIDVCIGEVIGSVLKVGGIVLLTADHGNAEKMIHGDSPHTAHTLNPVPFMVIGEGLNKENMHLRKSGVLGDIAPTVLELMDIEKPVEMDRHSLILRD